MIKRFKKFLMEDVIQESFDSFIEDVLSGKPIDEDKAQQFNTNLDFIYKGDSYRVLWIPNQEVMDKKRFKDIARFVSSKYLNAPNSYKIFYKSLEDAFGSKMYAKDTMEKTGIIFHITSKNALNLSKYTGTNDQIKDRINSTHPVLDFEPLNIETIDGKIVFDQNTDEGWQLITSDEQEQTKEEAEEKSKEKIFKKEEPEELNPQRKEVGKRSDHPHFKRKEE